jgi:hypothetical protein
VWKRLLSGLLVDDLVRSNAVGGVKISDNNGPMPRDRVYAVYNHFQHTFNSVNIERGTVGVEKSFSCGLWSAEVRVPFAAAVNSTQPSDGSIAEDGQLGNVELNRKALLYRGKTWLPSGGLVITFPTADDTHVTSGTAELVRIRNESVHLLPFVAALWAPECSRLFAQGFIQYDIDVDGNPVAINGAGSGRVQNTSYLYIDGGLGFYAYTNNDCDALIRSIAPTVELHYDLALENGHNLTSPTGITVGSTLGAINTLNLLLGGTVQIGNNTTFSAAQVTPRNDGDFNWEVNCALNIRFGPTSAHHAE